MPHMGYYGQLMRNKLLEPSQQAALAMFQKNIASLDVALLSMDADLHRVIPLQTNAQQASTLQKLRKTLR